MMHPDQIAPPAEAEQLPREWERALVEAGYAPLPEYVERWVDEPAEPASIPRHVRLKIIAGLAMVPWAVIVGVWLVVEVL